jgi:Outer membrane lipoprotein-sorting protein
LKVRVLLGFLCVSVCLASDTSVPVPDAIVDHYCAATRAQEVSIPGASMEVEIKGFLPKLKKYGKLNALRKISPLGLIKYERLFFEGDRTVNKEVIQRYLNAEIETQKEHRTDVAVTPENYRFKYKGLNRSGGRDVYVFQVTPKQKRQSLFRGEIWIDTETYLKVQESGYLVKNPSFLIKKVAFIRKYEIHDGISTPKQVFSVVNTRLVGKAELTIDFTKFELDSPRANAESGDQ